jgi:hypothetical protein
MENQLDHNPLWPAAVSALQARFEAWSGAKQAGERNDWRALAADLQALGLDAATSDLVIGWAGSRLADGRAGAAGLPPGILKTRLLHPMEREMLDTEAYGHLLDLYRLGLLDADGFEQVLEHCAQLTRLPATLEQARALTARALAGRIAAQGLGTAH